LVTMVNQLSIPSDTTGRPDVGSKRGYGICVTTLTVKQNFTLKLSSFVSKQRKNCKDGNRIMASIPFSAIGLPPDVNMLEGRDLGVMDGIDLAAIAQAINKRGEVYVIDQQVAVSCELDMQRMYSVGSLTSIAIETGPPRISINLECFGWIRHLIEKHVIVTVHPKVELEWINIKFAVAKPGEFGTPKPKTPTRWELIG